MRCNVIRSRDVGDGGERRAAAKIVQICLQTPAGQIAEDVLPLLPRTRGDVLVELAQYHAVGGWVYQSLRGLPLVGSSTLEPLRKLHAESVRLHMHFLWALDWLGAVFDATGIRWAILKGPVLVELCYGAPGRRTYQDLDVLVEPARFGEAVELLQQAGGTLLDRNWRMIRAEMRGQVHLVLPSGVPIDLHWNLINGRRGMMNIDTDTVLGRSRQVDLKQLSVNTLDHTDMLTHLGVHGAISGGDRLVWLKDIERTIAGQPPDWKALVLRSAEWNVSALVGLMLYRSVAVLNADVPPEVIGQLLGRRLIALSRAVDRLSPLEESIGGPTASRILSRVIGQGFAGGTSVIAYRSLRHFDPRGADASSPLREGGTDEDREAYFEAVRNSPRSKQHIT